MVHIYGHSWPVRWGSQGEKRTVRVYSNCERAELFLNGKSLGTMHRDSQNFPAAGLRWDVAFTDGSNHLRAIATKGGVNVEDEIALTYQSEPWSEPAVLKLSKKERHDNIVVVEAMLFDGKGVRCLDSAKALRFSLSGEGSLIDNLGTVRASRAIQLSNGRAQISVVRRGECRIEAKPDGLPAASLAL
jgi:beta-galactosidase